MPVAAGTPGRLESRFRKNNINNQNKRQNMGQYWKVVNLTKNEFITPHKLGCGLKLWEQLANHPGTGAALIILCAAMPEARGGGDFDLDANWHGPEREAAMKAHKIDGCTPGPMPEDYPTVAKRTIGRWAGATAEHAPPGCRIRRVLQWLSEELKRELQRTRPAWIRVA